MVTVIVIGGVLTGIALNSFSRVRGQLSTRSAQSNFMGLHAQARAFSVERGVPVRLVVDEGTDRVRVEVLGPAGTQVQNELDFQEVFGVDLVTGQGSVNICFTPGGSRTRTVPVPFPGVRWWCVQRGQPDADRHRVSPGPGEGGMMGGRVDQAEDRVPSPPGRDFPARAHPAFPSGRGGFSLVEVVVAMLVLTVGLLGLAAGTGWVIRSVEVARIETARAAALQSGIEQVRATPFDDLANGSATVGDYEVTWTELAMTNRSRLFEFEVVGPGVGPGGGSFAPILGDVATTFEYRVMR
jgi:prepilin-type N-terminal cleavage/methylation domain-containing protein